MLRDCQDLLFKGSVDVLDSWGQYLELVVVVSEGLLIDEVLELTIKLHAHSVLQVFDCSHNYINWLLTQFSAFENFSDAVWIVSFVREVIQAGDILSHYTKKLSQKSS